MDGDRVGMRQLHVGDTMTHTIITDGTPVPFSLTVSGVSSAAAIRRAAATWLARAKPGAIIERVDGQYVYYDYSAALQAAGYTEVV